MRTIIKVCTCLLIIFSFTACFPVLVSERGGYDHHRYENRRAYREHRRHNAEIKVRINTDDNHNRRHDRD